MGRKNKKDIRNYPRKLIAGIAVLIILTSTARETIRHYQIENNYNRVEKITSLYDGEEEFRRLQKEKQKRMQASDGLNAFILLIELSILLKILYSYDKKYFEKKK